MAEILGRGYVGGGSIAAICGLSPFHTPLDAWFHIVEPEKFTQEELDFFENRKALESYAASRFAKCTGHALIEFNQRHDDASLAWAKAEVDARTKDGGNVEIKTVRERMRDYWGDPMMGNPAPFYVEIQVQWGFGVTGVDFGYVMALIGFDDQRIYDVERRDDVIEMARERASNFWQWHVIPRRMPEPTTTEDLQSLFPRDTGRRVEVTEDVMAALELVDRHRRAIKLEEAQKVAAEFVVKNYMRDAAELTHRGRVIATLKADTRGTRPLRIL